MLLRVLCHGLRLCELWIHQAREILCSLHYKTLLRWWTHLLWEPLFFFRRCWMGKLQLISDNNITALSKQNFGAIRCKCYYIGIGKKYVWCHTRYPPGCIPNLISSLLCLSRKYTADPLTAPIYFLQAWSRPSPHIIHKTYQKSQQPFNYHEFHSITLEIEIVWVERAPSIHGVMDHGPDQNPDAPILCPCLQCKNSICKIRGAF